MPQRLTDVHNTNSDDRERCQPQHTAVQLVDVAAPPTCRLHPAGEGQVDGLPGTPEAGCSRCTGSLPNKS